jgi:hypothetical protein
MSRSLLKGVVMLVIEATQPVTKDEREAPEESIKVDLERVNLAHNTGVMINKYSEYCTLYNNRLDWISQCLYRLSCAVCTFLCGFGLAERR